MYLKIRCDEKSWKFFGFRCELNKALIRPDNARRHRQPPATFPRSANSVVRAAGRRGQEIYRQSACVASCRARARRECGDGRRPDRGAHVLYSSDSSRQHRSHQGSAFPVPAPLGFWPFTIDAPCKGLKANTTLSIPGVYSCWWNFLKFN